MTGSNVLCIGNEKFEILIQTDNKAHYRAVVDLVATLTDRPRTKADYIRTLSDGELVDKLYQLYLSTTDDGEFHDISMQWCDGGARCINDNGDVDCDEQRHKACILRWLRQPYQIETKEKRYAEM